MRFDLVAVVEIGRNADRTKGLWQAALLDTVRIAKNRHSPTGRRARWGNATQARGIDSCSAVAALARSAGRYGP
jgi:hypothetical protein